MAERVVLVNGLPASENPIRVDSSTGVDIERLALRGLGAWGR